MRYEMRKAERAMSEDQIRDTLGRCLYGVLSTTDADGMPYGLPLSYAYVQGNGGLSTDRIYFHGTPSDQSHKNDNVLAAGPEGCQASFTAVTDVETVPQKFTTTFASVIAFGRVRVADEAERRICLEGLFRKYSPDEGQRGVRYMESGMATTRVLVFVPDYMTGKVRGK